MSEQSVIHSTFVLEKNFPASPDKVFTAFADPAKKRRWMAEGASHHQVEQFESDFRVGGREHATYRFKEGTPFPGAVLEAEGTHLDIVPGKRVVIASTMALAGKRFSASLVTAEIVPNGTGSDLVLTHQGAFFEGADGPQMREAGWRELLNRLEKELAG